jgi:hypothetical protein
VIETGNENRGPLEAPVRAGVATGVSVRERGAGMYTNVRFRTGTQAIREGEGYVSNAHQMSLSPTLVARLQGLLHGPV